MEDPTNLILTLVGLTRLAENAFSLPHNSARYLSPSSNTATDISSRQTTPYIEDGHVEADEDNSSHHRLRLTFDQPPKDMQLGFVFGSDRASDVLFGNKEIGISGEHFCITFDEQRRIVLKDLSTCGTRVSYDGQGKDQPRSTWDKRDSFTWILFDDYFFNGCQNIEVIPGPIGRKGKKPLFKFEIDVERHKTCKAEYLARVDSFLKESRNALPPIGRVGLRSPDPTAAPTETLGPKLHQRPIYIYDRQLGRGQFGVVYKVINVSTGSAYAGKEFYSSNWMTDREVEVMKSVSHEHIAQFVNFTNELKPLLVMEYLRFGNLENQHQYSRLTEEEMVTVLNQCLSALEYLHGLGKGYAHRDIKPENILVESRTPFRIKLGDFGLAKEDANFKTRCGTMKYMAPEIFGRDDGTDKPSTERPYTHAVDIWSLGIIILEYVYGLPQCEDQGGWCWYRKIMDKMGNEESKDILIFLLKTMMLRMDPQERPSASRCLEEAISLGLLSGPTDEAGGATPTAKASLHKFKEGNDSNPTIIMGPLWASHQCDDSYIKASKRRPVSSGDRPTKRAATADQDVSWTMGYRIDKNGKLDVRITWPKWEDSGDEWEGFGDDLSVRISDT